MLPKKYRDIANALFVGTPDKLICRKFKISNDKLIECFRNKDFCDYMELLYKKHTMQARSNLIRHGEDAGQRLIDLLANEKEDISRKAAVDILAKCFDYTVKDKQKDDSNAQSACEISEDKAREMLSILADGIKAGR